MLLSCGWLVSTISADGGLGCARLVVARTCKKAGVAQLARVSAFQAEGCGFETRLPLRLEVCEHDEERLREVRIMSPCGSVVEHTLGKGEVASSILAVGFN